MKAVFKKSVAIMLAALILMSAGIAGISASANEVAGTLGFETKFFGYDEELDDWVETSVAKKGESLKARVYVDTDYFTNSGELLFFYDSDFFDADYEKNEIIVANVNPYYEQACNMEAQLVIYGEDHRAIQKMVDSGTITADFASEHTGVAVLYSFGILSPNMKLSGEEWLIELNLTVKEDTQAESGDFFAVETTVQSPENEYGFVNVPVGKEGEYLEDSEILFGVYVDVNVTKNPVSLEVPDSASYTHNVYLMNTDGSTYSVDSTVLNGTVNETVSVIPEEFEGFTFDESKSNTETVIAPDGSAEINHYYTRNQYNLVAWADGEVFNEYLCYYGGVIEDIASPNNKDGYEFSKWVTKDTKDEFVFPFEMPANNVDIEAVYDVSAYTVKFNTDGGNEIRSMTVSYGEEFVLPTATKTGCSLAFWKDSNGAVYSAGQTVTMPAKNLEFKAVWLVQSNSVTYVIGKDTIKYDVVPGETLPQPDMSAYENIEFLYWISEDGYRITPPAVMPESNLTYIAKINYVFVDDTYGITVSFANDVFDYYGEDLTLIVEKKSFEKASGGVNLSGVNYKQLERYYIGFRYGSTIVQPKAGMAVTVSIPVPAVYKDGTKFLVVHNQENGIYHSDILATKKGNNIAFLVGISGDFEVCVESGTTVKVSPSKTSYFYKEALNLSGLALETLGADGEKVVITDTSKMNVTGYDPKDIGVQTVTVEYDGTSTQFNVKVSYAWWQTLIRIFLLGFIWY